MPLSIRSIMKECKIDKSYAKSFLYNGYTLLFTFFLFRAVYLTVMSFWYVAPWYFNKYNLDVQLQDYSYFEVAITNIMFGFYWVLYLMNLWWFYKLVTGAMKFLKESKEEKSDDYKRKVDEKEQKTD